MQAQRAPQDRGVPRRGVESFPGMWSPPKDMDSFPGRQSPLRTWHHSRGNGVHLGETESPDLPSSSATLASGFLPKAASGLCCALLGGGLQDRWGWGWGWGDWYPELLAESGVSPMKYLLVLCRLFSWGQGCGEERDREGLRK